MRMTKSLEPHAALIVMRGQKQGHCLSSWYAAELRFESAVPPEAKVQEGSKLLIRCEDCAAWAALIHDEGFSVSSNDYDSPCPGPERLNAA
jgi:hypothetical protein